MLRTALVLGSCVAALACSQPDRRAEPGPSTARSEPAEPPKREPMDMPQATEVAPAATASNAFALDLYARLRERPGNLALSPASISIALAMTWGGARGPTAAQMQRVLHFEGEAEAVLPTWGRLSGALQDPRRTLTLRIANRLFGEQTFAFEPPFLERTAAVFDAPLQPTDFENAPDASRRQINAWVQEQTEDRIKDLLPEPAITAETRMVLVNAIYFLAQWAEKFERGRAADVTRTRALQPTLSDERSFVGRAQFAMRSNGPTRPDRSARSRRANPAA